MLVICNDGDQYLALQEEYVPLWVVHIMQNLTSYLSTLSRMKCLEESYLSPMYQHFIPLLTVDMIAAW